MVSLPKTSQKQQRYTTEPQPTQGSELFNKHTYTEFAGYQGERLYQRIVKCIIPQALARTALAMIAHQKPGNQLFVSSELIAYEEKPGLRKIEMDVQRLRELGLLRIETRALQMMGSGQVRRVKTKSFYGLDTLAHEYYLWEQSEEYIDPLRENINDIKQEPELEKRLRRFDNYRRVLDCKKPGRKPTRPPLCLFPDMAEEDTTIHLGHTPKDYSYKFATNRISNESLDSENSNLDTNSLMEGFLEPKHASDSYSPGTIAPGYMNQQRSADKPTITKRQTKQEKLNKWQAQDQRQAEQDQQTREKIDQVKEAAKSEYSTSEPIRHPNYSAELVNLIGHFSDELGDSKKLLRSNQTWILNQFAQAQALGIEREEFIELMYACFAYAWKVCNIKAKNDKGKRNRMPAYKSHMKKSLENIRKEIGEEEMPTRDTIDQAGQRHIEQENSAVIGVISKKVAQQNEIEAEVDDLRQVNKVRPTAQYIREQKARETFPDLRRFIASPLFVLDDCPACGGNITSVEGGKKRCITCYEGAWKPYLPEIKKIVSAIPTPLEAEQIAQSYE